MPNEVMRERDTTAPNVRRPKRAAACSSDVAKITLLANTLAKSMESIAQILDMVIIILQTDSKSESGKCDVADLPHMLGRAGVLPGIN